jgi:hypothetical protein
VSLTRSALTRKAAPSPSVPSASRRKAAAPPESQLAMVEPGKKPRRFYALVKRSGRATFLVKSPTTGSTGRPGKRSEKAAAESRRKSAAMSIGT